MENLETDTDKLLAEDSEKIHDLLNRGYSLRFIASEYKTTHQTIQRALADGRI